MAWEWWHTTAAGGVEVELDDSGGSIFTIKIRPAHYAVARHGPGDYEVGLTYSGHAAWHKLSPGRFPQTRQVPQVAPQPQAHVTNWSSVRSTTPVTLSGRVAAMQHTTRKFYLDFSGARDTVLDLEVEFDGTDVTVTNCDANKRQFQRIWPYIGLDRFSVEAGMDLLVDSMYIGVLRLYTAPAAPQRDKGTCQQCGDTGEFIRMALTCRRGHGLIGGC